MNRRQFLIGSTALATVAAVGAPAFAEQPMTATEVTELNADFLREFDRNIQQAFENARFDLIMYGRAEVKMEHTGQRVIATWQPLAGSTYGRSPVTAALLG